MVGLHLAKVVTRVRIPPGALIKAYASSDLDVFDALGEPRHISAVNLSLNQSQAEKLRPELFLSKSL